LRILKKLLIVLLILWGVLAFMVRAATPFIADYRDQLAGLVAERLGVPVKIGGLKARWYGLRPLLEFNRVRLGDPRGEVLDVGRVTLDLAPGDLLRGAWVEAMRVTIDGMQVTVIREPTGQLRVKGIGILAAKDGSPRTPAALPSHVQLLNTQVLWIDRKAGTAPLPINHVAVVLDRVGSRLKLRASLETERGKADLSARLDGLLTTTTWDGDTYLRVANLDVADLFARYMPARYGLRSLRLDLESWTHWEDAAPKHSQGRFQLRDLDLRPQAEDALPLEVWQADARFSFTREGQGLRLGLKDLQLTFHDHRWPTGDLAFALTPGPDGSHRIDTAVDFLRIEDVVRILQVRLPWAELKGPLQQLRPAGEVRDLRLTADVSANRVASWRGLARFTGVSVAPSAGIPGVQGLSGELHGQQDRLVLLLDSHGTTVDFHGMFRAPIELTTLEGRLDLVIADDGWRLSSERLRAANPDIGTLSRLRVERLSERPLWLDLQTDFRDGDAAQAGRYYPVSIMSDKLVDWLDHSIVAGRVVQGTALFYGPLHSFPFHHEHDGVFQVVFDTEDVVLDYRDGWPGVEQLDAHVKFHGNQLDIQAASGLVYDSHIVEATARIDSLMPTAPIHITGQLDGPLRNTLRILGEPALRSRFGRFAEILRGAGDSSLLLDFTVPLAGHGEYALDGRLRLADNRLALPDGDLTVDQVSGTLNFTLDGLSAKGIQARLLETPVRVDVTPLGDGASRIQAKGRFTPDAIANRFDAIPTALLAGDADFTVSLDVPRQFGAQRKPPRLAVESELQGISVALPPPFGKRADERRVFNLRMPLGEDDAPGSLGYAGLVSARFSHDGQRVDVTLGGAEAQLRPTPGIRIDGRLNELDVALWGEPLAALRRPDVTSQPAVDVNLNIDRLRADTVTLKQLHLTASRTPGMWRGGVEAPNLAGTFEIPEDFQGSPVRVDLQRLNLTVALGSDEVEIAPLPDPTGGPDPTTLPGLAIGIADLRVNDAHLGRLRIDAHRAADGLHVTELSLGGGQLELESAGHWSREPGGYVSRLGGRVSTRDLGDLLVGLGYSRQVEGAGGSAEFLLDWPGNPIQYHRASVRGDVRLDVGAGRLAELDPGVTRVVGLLNLNALTRRLRLDFSDIYKKGYTFDSIRGGFRFERGIARTGDLSVLGPSGRIDLSGSADLMARSLDQRVKVTPNLDATLPIAGTIAGGPVAGIAVLVAQKVMTKQVDNINRFEYSLSGPWATPEVKQLDTGGTLSKILQPFNRAEEATPVPAAGSSEPASPAPPAVAPPSPAAPPSEAADAGPEAMPAEAGAPGKSGMLRRIWDVLKSGESHGGDIPGTSD